MWMLMEHIMQGMVMGGVRGCGYGNELGLSDLKCTLLKCAWMAGKFCAIYMFAKSKFENYEYGKFFVYYSDLKCSHPITSLVDCRLQKYLWSYELLLELMEICGFFFRKKLHLRIMKIRKKCITFVTCNLHTHYLACSV